MGSYIIDLAILTVLVIGITATMGVIANGFGEKIGGKAGSTIVNRDLSVKAGWKSVGGKKKK
ncbi:hypothetical protein ACLM5H_01410 [Fredinandcohnia humi]